MTRNWIAVNAILMLLAGFLGWKLYASARSFKATNDVARIQPVKDFKQKIALEGGMPAMQPPPQYNVADFAVIPAQNVFSDTRSKEEKVEAAPAVPEVPALTVRPILVGVTLSGDQKIASVVDPTAAGAPHRSQAKRLGDTFQTYTITDITKDQMVLERGNRREVIPLFDASKHPAQGAAAQTGRTPILPTRVIAFGGGGSGATSGPGVAQPMAGGARPIPVSASSSAGQAAAAQSQNRVSPVQPGRQIAPTSQQSAPTPAQGDSRPTRVIRTPFGDVPVRPD